MKHSLKRKKLLKGYIPQLMLHLNLHSMTAYKRQDVPRKYRRGTAEFMDMLATDLQTEAQKLLEKKV